MGEKVRNQRFEINYFSEPNRTHNQVSLQKNSSKLASVNNRSIQWKLKFNNTFIKQFWFFFFHNSNSNKFKMQIKLNDIFWRFWRVEKQKYPVTFKLNLSIMFLKRVNIPSFTYCKKNFTPRTWKQISWEIEMNLIKRTNRTERSKSLWKPIRFHKWSISSTLKPNKWIDYLKTKRFDFKYVLKLLLIFQFIYDLKNLQIFIQC